MAMVSTLDLLRRVPLFSALTEEQAELIAGAVVKRRLKRGEAIVEQGKKSNALFILLTGRARVIATDARGREVILATLGPGDYLGEMSLIDNLPHSATVRTEVQSDLLMLGRTEFLHCVPENAPMMSAMLIGMVRRLRSADRKIKSLALLDVYGRVAHTLLEQSVEVATGERLINRRISRQDLARMVGASREMVSRVMKELEQEGLIQSLEDGSIVIHENLGTELN